MHIKKLVTCSIVLLCLYSCQEAVQIEEDDPLEHRSEQMIHSMEEGDLEVMTIEGCQYFVYKEAQGPNHAYGYMAHKGNCKNPIHCRTDRSSIADSTSSDLDQP